MSVRGLSTRERLIIGALVLAILLSGIYFAARSGSDPAAYGNDFNVYYHAAREVISGRDPYQKSLGDWTPYIYPPLLAELISPLALLPLPIAAYLWFLISAASVVAAGWMSANLALNRAESPGKDQNINDAMFARAIAACAVVVVVRFVLDNFNLGQVNNLVVALVVLHIYLYVRDRKTLSAFALVLAVSIKLTPLVLLLYHIAKLRIKFAVACAALLLAVMTLSFLPFGLRGAEVFHTFWSRTVRNEQGYDLAYSGNQSLRGAIARTTDGDENAAGLKHTDTSRAPSDKYTLLISIGLLALAVYAALGARGEAAAAAPFFCCMVMLSPLSWKAHYVAMIPPIAYLLVTARTFCKARIMIWATLGVVFGLFNLTSPRVIGVAAAEWADEHSMVFAGALIVLFACVGANILSARRDT